MADCTIHNVCMDNRRSNAMSASVQKSTPCFVLNGVSTQWSKEREGKREREEERQRGREKQRDVVLLQYARTMARIGFKKKKSLMTQKDSIYEQSRERGREREKEKERERELVSWCFGPSQPQRIISGLNTNFTLSSSYSFHKSSYYKSCCCFFHLFRAYGILRPAGWLILFCGPTREPVLAKANTGKNRERF